MTEKIDKRSKAYRDSQQDSAQSGVPGEDNQLAPRGERSAETIDIANPVILGWPQGGDVAVGDTILPDPVEIKLGHILALVEEIHTAVIHPRMTADPDTHNVTQLEPPKKPVGDLTNCMRCERDLPPTETPRTVQELCHECVWRNK